MIMVEINKQRREIKITIGNSDVSTLDLMAKALIDLMQNYNFTEAGSYTGIHSIGHYSYFKKCYQQITKCKTVY